MIGINAQIRSSLSSGFEGVGFAVPVDSVRRSLRELLSSGHVLYAYLGLTSEDLTPSIAARFGYPARYGALIESVAKNGPAAKARLRAGTRIVSYDGQSLTVAATRSSRSTGPDAQLRRGRGLCRRAAIAGEVARLTVIRDGVRRAVRVVLGVRPA